LAANQIGHSEALCIINAPEQIPMVLINPKITWYSSETCIMGEGCLSCKKIYKNIRRPNAIRIKYRDLNYQEHTKKLTGILARIAQHEIDHLNGKLIIDYK